MGLGPGTSTGEGRLVLHAHVPVGLDVLGHASCVEDLDLAGLGLLRHGDGDREHAVLAGGGEVVTVQALPEEQLTAELALGPLRYLDLIAFGREPP